MPRTERIIGIAYLALCAAVLVSTLSGGPRFYAPLALIAPPATPVTITLATSAEKEAWLKQAIERFTASRPHVGQRPIQVELQSVGSLQLVDDILSGKLRPTAISPDSTLELKLLEKRWREQGAAEPILATADLAPRPLAFSPLVLIIWEDLINGRWAQGTFTWDDLYAAATAGDTTYVKLGHTRPTTSHSGLALLTLLAQHYHRLDSGDRLSEADISEPAFQSWLTSFERGVSQFEDSTVTQGVNMIRFGPSRYQAIVSYEHLAIQHAVALQERWGPVRILYPPTNMASDHPFAILRGDWVDGDQQEAARILRDYLLSREGQQLALEHGLRPANAEAPLQSPQSPFQTFAANGINAAIQPELDATPVEVAQALVDFWAQDIGR